MNVFSRASNFSRIDIVCVSVVCIRFILPSYYIIKMNTLIKPTSLVKHFFLLILRHKPALARLTLDSSGFAPLDTLLDYLGKRKKITLTREQVAEIVKNKAGKLLQIKGDQIRARFGHSVILSMEVPKDATPVQKVAS